MGNKKMENWSKVYSPKVSLRVISQEAVLCHCHLSSSFLCIFELHPCKLSMPMTCPQPGCEKRDHQNTAEHYMRDDRNFQD